MSGLTLAGLSTPLLALRTVAAEFADLPAPSVHVSTVVPDRLELAFHEGGFGAFEAWRQALNLASEDVAHHVQSGGRTGVLTVHGRFAGATVELVGYSPVPAAEAVLTGAGVGS
ncbi:hypothetical protein [Streptomyces sp. NBC_01268]|uniref:hypothetical protein n=1 Tax=Streptomyces sp. NBC_01268 TaxID=2903806 RepID=UPI002E32E64B|nr:hypothetical protein [Streptomyces sp. NBC_01268]